MAGLAEGQGRKAGSIVTNSTARVWERKLLAEILLDNRTLDAPSFSSLQPSDFEDHRNFRIFVAMNLLRICGRMVTIESLCDLLREHGQLENAGGEQYVASLACEVVALGFGPRGESRRDGSV
jgi:replicative DNA helicase